MSKSKLNEAEVKVISASFDLENSKKFSAVLKPFKKRYTDYGPLFDKDAQWIEVFQITLSLYHHAQSESVERYTGTTRRIGTRRYNLLRFMRLLAASFSVQVDCYEELTRLYWGTLFDPDGKIRNAGYQFLVNMQFGLPRRSSDAKTTASRKNWMELFFDLLHTERYYEIENKNHLLRSDLTGRKWRKHSTDTKDVYLKNIRRAIELIDHGFYLDEILDEFGMLERVRHSDAVQKYRRFKNKRSIF